MLGQLGAPDRVPCAWAARPEQTEQHVAPPGPSEHPRTVFPAGPRGSPTSARKHPGLGPDAGEPVWRRGTAVPAPARLAEPSRWPRAGANRLLSFFVRLFGLLHLLHHLVQALHSSEVLQHLRVHAGHHRGHGLGVHVADVRLLSQLLVLLHCLLHGGLHHLELLEELDHLPRVVARALCDAHHATHVHHLRVVELLVSHRVHDGHPALDAQGGLPEVEALHAREGVHDAAQRAHLHDRLELFAHVAERPLPRGEALHHLGPLEVHVGLLHALHEARDVAAPEEPRDECLHLKVLEVVDVLARADVDDGRLGGCHSGERAAALGVAVQLGDDAGAHGHLLLEGLRLVVRRLANGRVHHKDHVVGLRGRRDLLHLLEERPLLPVPPRGVHDDDLVALFLEFAHPVARDHRRVGLRVRAVEGDLGLGGVLLELVEGPGSEGVRAHEAGLPALALVHVGVLGAGGRLARTLEAHKHDHVGALLLGLVGLHSGVQHAAELLHDGRLD
mmetsp:Transcript_18677/g.62615  ORF Transcript_18677/g.62615 Transcript_18677/m.62615 type:complete len:503 (+) Transcript_18677:231-1739(+)